MPLEPSTSTVELAPLPPAVANELDGKAGAFVAQLLAQQAGSAEFVRKAVTLSEIGHAEITRLASQSGRLLERSARATRGGGLAEEALTALRSIVEELDPARAEIALGPRRLFGLIPLRTRVNAYFDRFRVAEGRIADVLGALASGRDALLKDNIAIDTERRNLRDAMEGLQRMIHVCRSLDARLEAAATVLDARDPRGASVVRGSALFPVRQRMTDLLTQMAVSRQGYLGLDLVLGNNVELIEGVGRASTITIAALKTAMVAAQALTARRLVLTRITALGRTAVDAVDASDRILNHTAVDMGEKPSRPGGQIEGLQRAFDEVRETMAAVDRFAARARGAMRQTVHSLTGEVEEAGRSVGQSDTDDQQPLLPARR